MADCSVLISFQICVKDTWKWVLIYLNSIWMYMSIDWSFKVSRFVSIQFASQRHEINCKIHTKTFIYLKKNRFFFVTNLYLNVQYTNIDCRYLCICQNTYTGRDVRSVPYTRSMDSDDESVEETVEGTTSSIYTITRHEQHTAVLFISLLSFLVLFLPRCVHKCCSWLNGGL